MNGFLQRLGLVIHWFGFIFGIWAFVIGMYIGFTTTNSAINFLVSPLMLFAFTGLGWLVRYILIGKCDFFPYR